MSTGRKSIQALAFLILILFSSEGFSQLTPVTDQYMLNPVLINPAYAGGRGALSIAAFYRRQWVGIKGAPETITLTADAPAYNGNIGLGVSVTSDKVGVTRTNSFSTYYSYRIETSGGNLLFGLKAGLTSTNTRWSDLVVLEPGDELFLVDSKVFVVPDFSFGAYYSNDTYFIGFSIPRLLGYEFNYDRNRYSVRVNPGQYYYLFNGGYTFQIAPEILFSPSTLISLSPGEKALIDLNAHFIFSGKMWAGLSLRSNKSLAGLFQFAVSNQMKVAYSYYLDFGRLGRFNNGSHEIMLRYEFLYRADIVNPLIF